MPKIRKVGIYCGSKWYRLYDWKMYGAFRRIKGVGFSIGPILFWDGS